MREIRISVEARVQDSGRGFHQGLMMREVSLWGSEMSGQVCTSPAACSTVQLSTFKVQ